MVYSIVRVYPLEPMLIQHLTTYLPMVCWTTTCIQTHRAGLQHMSKHAWSTTRIGRTPHTWTPPSALPPWSGPAWLVRRAARKGRRGEAFEAFEAFERCLVWLSEDARGGSQGCQLNKNRYQIIYNLEDRSFWDPPGIYLETT